MMEFVKSLGKGSGGSVNLIRVTKPDGSNPYYHARLSRNRANLWSISVERSYDSSRTCLRS
ncbi:BnaC04g13000D [Brassica napus]|uniref:BnaC04g13000D protein n=1 Tax=Brassica napus TaxID=3708 RepID=A0A078HAL0_BRANA|nr:BnaC04g13000D [Brassica napus]